MGKLSNAVKAVREALFGGSTFNNDKHALTEEIQDALEKENVELVRILVGEHPEAATGFQRSWLDKRLKRG